MASGDVTLLHYLLVAAVAFLAAIVGGVAGYGTGLLLPPILVPIIGPQAVVPVIAVSALMTNASRLIAFRAFFDPPRAVLIAVCALPFCLLGAFLYTLLSSGHVAMLIGTVLILLAAGLQGPAVIATDAGISLVLGTVKTLVFQTAGALPLSSWLMAAVIGVAALPGAFIARRLAHRLSLKAHTAILDAVVIWGGTLLIVEGFSGS